MADKNRFRDLAYELTTGRRAPTQDDAISAWQAEIAARGITETQIDLYLSSARRHAAAFGDVDPDALNSALSAALDALNLDEPMPLDESDARRIGSRPPDGWADLIRRRFPPQPLRDD